MSSHMFEEIEHTCDRVLMIKRGELWQMKTLGHVILSLSLDHKHRTSRYKHQTSRQNFYNYQLMPYITGFKFYEYNRKSMRNK